MLILIELDGVEELVEVEEVVCIVVLVEFGISGAFAVLLVHPITPKIITMIKTIMPRMMRDFLFIGLLYYILEPPPGLEPGTFALQKRCSTS